MTVSSSLLLFFFHTFLSELFVFFDAVVVFAGGDFEASPGDVEQVGSGGEKVGAYSA